MDIHSTEVWTHPASWKKTRGNENHAYFHGSKGGRKLKLLKHIVAL